MIAYLKLRLQALIFPLFFLAACSSNPEKAATNIPEQDSTWLLPFNKIDSANPVLQPGNLTFECPVQNKPVKWEGKNVYNPAIAIKNDALFLLYRAQDSAGCSRIGIAKSVDGIHFEKYATPVLYPMNDAYKKMEWPGGCEDPRLVQDSTGTYYLTYTAYDGKTARLMMATSTDLYNWQKHGPVFKDDKYQNMWSKSGAIVSTYANNKITATKINGKYYMYWGDKYIWTATSTDLLNWTPQQQQEDNHFDSIYAGYNISTLQIAVLTRSNMFDNNIVESGPPAILTDKGILLIYNGRNVSLQGDSSLPEGTYTVSQVLLDKRQPEKIISRMNNYFLKPEKHYELSGEVNNVCFAEALAFYKNKWWLYYGTADSKIAVAVKDNK